MIRLFMLGVQEIILLIGCCSVPIFAAIIAFLVVQQSGQKSTTEETEEDEDF